ncbi:MAG: NAD(P)/FAD-dependent oxidoreductase [Bacteroidota bacterium]
MEAENKPVAILGAGLAGLLTAYRLQQFGIPYLLFEGRERLGGRIHTITTEGGGTIEMGATWFAPKHQHLLALINELGLSYENQYTGNKVLYDYLNPDRKVQAIDIPIGNEPSLIFTKGTHDIIQALANRIDQKSIHLGEQVKALSFEKGACVVRTNQAAYAVQTIVNTLPPNLFINSIDFTPDLPENLIKLCSTTHTWMGESIKAALVFDHSPWRKQHIGSLFSQLGPFTELHDHMHSDVKINALKGFMHPGAHEWSIEGRKQNAIDQLKLYFPKHDLTPRSYHEFDWQNEPMTFHQYQSELSPHQNNGHPHFRESFFEDRLFFAGSETAQFFPGYMDGAVERAESVAQQIIKTYSDT